MDSIFVDFDEDVPRYACSACSHCNSIMGKSLCSFKNRGCCWYFPKFTLFDIHKMVMTEEGLNILEAIKKNPLTHIFPYYIHAKGFYDEEGHKKYLSLEKSEDLSEVRDCSIFFRACTFVKEGFGCTLPTRYRTHVCNLYICDEIVNMVANSAAYLAYKNDLSRYARWIDWENASLQLLLQENHINLKIDFSKSIQILQSTPLVQYDFPILAPIKLLKSEVKGA